MYSNTLRTDADYEALLARFNTFLFDCDGNLPRLSLPISRPEPPSFHIPPPCRFVGVLWHGNRVIPGVPEAMNLLRSKGKQLLFVTNNSSVSRAAYSKKFAKLGIEAHVVRLLPARFPPFLPPRRHRSKLTREQDEMFSSAYAAAVYLKKVVGFPPEKKVYIIGQSGIQEELTAEGIQHSGAGDDNENMREMEFASLEPDPAVGAVLCGIDFHINYKKYAKAHAYLTRNPGCLFLLTNNDSTFPTEIGLFPGAGAISSALVTSTGRQPDAILGKPNQTMMDCIIARYHLDLATTLMVGDRLDTDIDFGNRGGLATLAVLTGVTTEAEIADPSQKIRPTFVMKSWGDLAKLSEN
ncbi:HAD-like domain-containing protein [Jimgerdemannia flammicorona]|uniref:4-nitrophenylphosphatase n=1 Tax=Jimgerdemannia flammicorona TaxID=994334 RepID=A0A433QF96_9FUNG|nr:HAD-like domain-containing protein [Jimgerdemannia flammicorona]